MNFLFIALVFIKILINMSYKFINSLKNLTSISNFKVEYKNLLENLPSEIYSYNFSFFTENGKPIIPEAAEIKNFEVIFNCLYAFPISNISFFH